MTYREYLLKSDFEQVWTCLQNDFGEASELRSNYEHLFEAVKKLPKNPSDKIIVITGNPPMADLYATNVLDNQEELVDREIRPDLYEMGVTFPADPPHPAHCAECLKTHRQNGQCLVVGVAS